MRSCTGTREKRTETIRLFEDDHAVAIISHPMVGGRAIESKTYYSFIKRTIAGRSSSLVRTSEQSVKPLHGEGPQFKSGPAHFQ